MLTTRDMDDMDAHNAHVIDTWNATVTADDTVLILGDVVMGDRHAGLPLVDRLNGRKLLLPGNHDHNWLHNPRRVTAANDWPAIYARHFDMVIADGFHTLPVLGDVFLSHFPVTGDHGPVDRHPDARPPADLTVPLIHGHLHGDRGRFPTPTSVDVGWDAWGAPITLQTLADAAPWG
jgi:calcineurin-like phosphoesterase family protein